MYYFYKKKLVQNTNVQQNTKQKRITKRSMQRNNLKYKTDINNR